MNWIQTERETKGVEISNTVPQDKVESIYSVYYLPINK